MRIRRLSLRPNTLQVPGKRIHRRRWSQRRRQGPVLYKAAAVCIHRTKVVSWFKRRRLANWLRRDVSLPGRAGIAASVKARVFSVVGYNVSTDITSSVCLIHFGDI